MVVDHVGMLLADHLAGGKKISDGRDGPEMF